MIYCVKQNSILIDQDLTKQKAELICMEYNLMHKENHYRILEQTARMEREWEGHYD